MTLAASAYAPLEWIPPLLDFVRKVVSDYPSIKIFGICFGHQIVSSALGGTCIPNEQGWEVGTYDVDLNTTGKLIFGKDVLVSILPLGFEFDWQT